MVTTTARGIIENSYLKQDRLHHNSSVTIVIPCLNEEGNLERLLLNIEETFEDMGFSLPVLVVDDGSTDNSYQILKQMSEKCDYLRIIRHPYRLGVTGVWKTALDDVKTDWIFWGQADLESDPRTDLPLLLKACVPGVDAVAGWRQKRGDGKILASKLANTTCRLLFGLKIHDMNWIKLVRRDLLSTLPVETITHRYLLAVLAAQKYNVIEVATPWHPRHSGTSKFGKKRLLTSAIDFVKLWWWFQTQGRLINQRQDKKIDSAINYVGVIQQEIV
ncbi:family 2 glycosyl transferase [Nostoc commune NIES-4072]|uniref:Family 2 glycosyl transferase n=1 Tax=Nostoc commune NIES-4072 TaxID=2005467 RepID=A0A2R5FSC4_NOSCO|nr:glycosyltransferase family 2 protein [Nostoc commune]BBD67368.1 family 2 glycosyl transferase [Nostoc commune HK-02]GBG21650.1 family 2 glycosyl transferase [Nostoc commune NIES-4072]